MTWANLLCDQILLTYVETATT